MRFPQQLECFADFITSQNMTYLRNPYLGWWQTTNSNKSTPQGVATGCIHYGATTGKIYIKSAKMTKVCSRIKWGNGFSISFFDGLHLWRNQFFFCFFIFSMFFSATEGCEFNFILLWICIQKWEIAKMFSFHISINLMSFSPLTQNRKVGNQQQ